MQLTRYALLKVDIEVIMMIYITLMS